MMMKPWNWIRKIFFLGLVSWAAGPMAHAGVFEIGMGFSFNKSEYAADDYTWARRWSASVGYHFTETSGIEVSYQMVTTRTYIATYQDTTFNDQVYSLNWVQSILPQKTVFQPFFKIGVGQLNRDASGTYAGGSRPPFQIDSLTGILALGFKLYALKNVAFRVEGNTYLVGGSLATWQNNLGLVIGGSFYF